MSGRDLGWTRASDNRHTTAATLGDDPWAFRAEVSWDPRGWRVMVWVETEPVGPVYRAALPTAQEWVSRLYDAVLADTQGISDDPSVPGLPLPERGRHRAEGRAG